MRAFLEQTLRQKVSIQESDFSSERFPLFFKGRYSLYNVETNGVSWMAISPKSNVGLVTLRKDRIKVEMITGLNCAIFLEATTFYIKEKLIEEGIPFAIKGKQVYLPFIGVLLSNSKERTIAPVQMISFLTQKTVLTAIYERWENVTVSEAASKLGVTKMSVSRCFDELEYLNIDILVMKGKSRAITVPIDVHSFWNDIQSVLRNPVIMKYYLSEDIKLEKKAGITALCEYSMLSDNKYPTYAVTKKEISASGIKKMKQVNLVEEIGCVVHEMGYFIDYEDKNVSDPLSVYLSLTEQEKQDERINISIQKMLEDYVW